MRIVAGEFRGRRLHSPKGSKIRPTSDRVREAIFNIIATELRDAQVLDLFAGTGALGLEALSRGAAQAIFVDQDADALRLIRVNIETCGIKDRTKVIQGSAQQAIRRLTAAGETFNLIFMDPPYGKGLVEQTLPQLESVADSTTLLVVEHHVKDVIPAQSGEWLRTQERRYGDTSVSFFVRNLPC
jgi:16S rRNA (guanine966-N2)-methyltransferase